jgi:hypothetical protein
MAAFASGSEMRLVNPAKSFDFCEKTWTWTFDHLAQNVIHADALNQRTVRDLKLAVCPKSSNI